MEGVRSNGPRVCFCFLFEGLSASAAKREKKKSKEKQRNIATAPRKQRVSNRI
jgi:hypothetical protein